MFVEQLAYVWVEDSTEATRASIEKKIDSFVKGDLEHAAETVSGLWKAVNEDGEVKAPFLTLPAVSYAPVGTLYHAYRTLARAG